MGVNWLIIQRAKNRRRKMIEIGVYKKGNRWFWSRVKTWLNELTKEKIVNAVAQKISWKNVGRQITKNQRRNLKRKRIRKIVKRRRNGKRKNHLWRKEKNTLRWD